MRGSPETMGSAGPGVEPTADGADDGDGAFEQAASVTTPVARKRNDSPQSMRGGPYHAPPRVRAREDGVPPERTHTIPRERQRHHGADIMDEQDFEGTLVLERLSEVGSVEDFFDAIDSDDVERAASLMRRAHIDAATIAIVIRKMEAADGEH
jgi:hypothetical protein